MSDKRRLWQIHLSTAVLMMFFAGGIMYENKIPHRLHCFTSEHPELPDVYGWPFPVFWGDGWVILREESPRIPWTLRSVSLGVTLDFISAMMMLAAAAFFCEFLIRRRERRKL